MVCRRVVLSLGIALLLSQYFASGVITVDKALIKGFLERYFDREEALTGRYVDRKKLLAAYTDDTTLSKEPPITLTDIVQVYISLKEGSATITHNDFCDISDQISMDKSFDRISSAFSQFNAAYVRLKDLDSAAGKKYCNFFAYLVCKDDPKTTGTHRCFCPSGMTWAINKCVFKSGEQCRDFSGQESEDKKFSNYDFISGDFTRHIAENCEGKKEHCARPNYYHTCEPDENFDYYATPLEIATFLRKHADANPSHTLEMKTEMTRIVMHQITASYRRDDRRDLSLEFYMENRLLAHGQACDFAQDSPLDKLMETYSFWNRRYTSQFLAYYMGYDTTRRAFQTKVMDYGPAARICNHFKLLRCTPAGICDCKPKLVYDPSTSLCAAQNSYLCEAEYMKLFEIKLRYYELAKPDVTDNDDTVVDEYDWDSYEEEEESRASPTLALHIDYYEFHPTVCGSGTICQDAPIPDIGLHSVCLKPGELDTTVVTLVEDFHKKFSIDLNGDCSPNDHNLLFQISINDVLTQFADVRKAIETIVASSVKYCRIREHATCSLAGKCACVPPTVPEGNTCTVPYYGVCGKHQTNYHLELDKLVISLSKPVTPLASDNLFCPGNSMCYDDDFLKKRLCSCEPGKYGANCDVYEHYNVDHLEPFYLPSSMHTMEGRKVIAELHESMSQLESSMTLKYDQTCTSQDHTELESIVNFLEKIRDTCNCGYRYDWQTQKNKWKCQDFGNSCNSNPEYEKPSFDALLQRVKVLASKSPSFCERTKGIRCISGTCGCPADNFFYHADESNCKVELGVEGICRVARFENDMLSTLCRPGSTCSGFRRVCTSTNPIVKDIRFDYGSPEQYLAELKQALVNYLKDAKKTFKRRSTLDENELCGHDDLAILKKAQLELDPLLDSIKDGDIHHERGEIRLLEILANEINEIVRKPLTKFCSEDLRCSTVTGTCKRPRKPYTKYGGSPLGMQGDVFTIIPLVAVAVYF